MASATDHPTLELENGMLRVRGWPSPLRPPFGLSAEGQDLRGPARLRAAVRDALVTAGTSFDDRLAPPALEAGSAPRAPDPPPPVLHAWLANDGKGVVCGLPEVTRVDLVLAAVHARSAAALVVARDSGAVHAWQTTLRGHGIAPGRAPEAIGVTTVADAARTMHWRAKHHELLVVDRPEQMPHTALAAVVDGSAALLRLAFVDRASRELLRWTAGLGPLFGVMATAMAPPRIELRVALSADERATYDAAWHTFLRAFDAFAALQPNAGFHTFVQQARADEKQRPSLLAWHRALQVAGWNVGKARVCADLLARHRGQRVLVFTPDRRSAYDLARTHLITPLTAELPRGERDAALSAFRDGSLRVLAGPRLLDLGVPERCADVGILLASAFGSAQHETRCRRVARNGLLYELLALDTVEVGRARRFDRATAAAPVAVPRRGG